MKSSACVEWFEFGGWSVRVRHISPMSAMRGALFFLHGRLSHGAAWDPIVQKLSPHYWCISVDLPGFGESFSIGSEGLSLARAANLVAELVERYRRPGLASLLIGQDLGGAIAQLATLRRSDLVDGLVLMNSACICEPVDKAPLRLGGIGLAWRVRRWMSFASQLSDEAQRELRAEWSNPRRKRRIQSIREFEKSWPGLEERRLWRKRMSGFPLPVLLLWGMRDPLNGSNIADELVRRYPEVYFNVHQDYGHWLQLEDPDWVADKIRDFSVSKLSFARRSLSR